MLNINKYLAISFSALMFSTIAHANTSEIENQNEIPTQGPVLDRLDVDCGSAKLMTIRESISEGPLIFSAMFFTFLNGKASTTNLTEQFEEIITTDYDLSDMKLGCLEEGHGHGLIIPSLNYQKDDLHIQVTTEGRVFEGYNHAGYTILNKANDIK